MDQEAKYVKWKEASKVSDAKYSEARAMLLHFGFTESARNHTTYWSHPLLSEDIFPGGYFRLTEPHGNDPLYSKEVRKVVRAISEIKSAQKEQEEQNGQKALDSSKRGTGFGGSC